MSDELTESAMASTEPREHAFKAELQARIDRLDRGEGIVLEDEAALRRFFDDVQARGMKRYHDSNSNGSRWS